MENGDVSNILAAVKSIPALPVAVQRIAQLTDDSDAGGRDVARIISMDQALTSQVLRIANSAFYGLSRRVPTVSQAVMILGFSSVKNIALGVSVFGFQSRPEVPTPLDREQFWRHCLAVAIGARMLTTRIRLCSPEEAFSAGLLHDIGKIILVEQRPQEYQAILCKAAPELSLCRKEREKFKLDHAEVGAALCDHWKLPTNLGRVAANHHDLNLPVSADTRMARVIQVADNLAKLAELGDGGDRRVQPQLLSVLKRDGVQSEQLRQVLLAFPGELQKAEQFFNLKMTPSPKLRECPAAARSIAIFVSNDDLRELIAMSLLYQGYAISSADVQPEAPALAGVIADKSLPPPVRRLIDEQKIPWLDAEVWCEQIAGSAPADAIRHWCDSLPR